MKINGDYFYDLNMKRLCNLYQCSTFIGNDNLHTILSAKNYKLRIDLEDWNGFTKFADYATFAVGNESTNFLLNISGYNGDAGKNISYLFNFNN